MLSLVVASVTIFLTARFCFEHPHVNDVRSFYRGAAAQASSHLADLYRDQRSAPPPLELPFIRPPVYALLIEPLAYLPFATAFSVWVAIQSAIFLTCLYLAQARTTKAAIACLFPPAILGIAHGQDCAFFLGILVLSYLLLREEKDLSGGVVLGLGLLKFHLFLLWPMALALRHRWRALTGFCLVGAVMAAASLAIVGVAGLKDYYALLTDPALTGATPGLAREVGIDGLMASLGISSPAAEILGGVGIAALALFAVRRGSIEWLFVIIPAAALASMPHALYYDPTMLLLPLWIVFSLPDAALLRVFAIILASPVVFITPALPEPWSGMSGIGLLVFLFAAMWKIAAAEESGQTVLA